MVELSEEEVRFVAEKTIRDAQKAANKFGLNPGDIVAHPSNRYTYRLVRIMGDQMIVERPVDPKDQEGRKITKTLPLEGAFDVRLATEGGEFSGGYLNGKKLTKIARNN